MKHIILLETADLEQLFGEGLELPAGADAVIKANRGDLVPHDLKAVMQGTMTAAGVEVFQTPLGKLTVGHPSDVARHVEAEEAKKRGKKKRKGEFVCQDHGKEFGTASGLKSHNLRHHKDKPVKYSLTDPLLESPKKNNNGYRHCCGKVRTRAGHLYHVRGKHDGHDPLSNDKATPGWGWHGKKVAEPVQGEFVCGPCKGFVAPFSTKADLEKHQVERHGMKVVA